MAKHTTVSIRYQIAQKVRIWRLKRKYTLKDLVDKTSINYHTLLRYEQGTCGIPVEKLKIIAESLSIPIRNLFPRRKVLKENSCFDEARSQEMYNFIEKTGGRKAIYALTKSIRAEEESNVKAARIRIAKNLVKAGFDTEIIYRATGLSTEEYADKERHEPNGGQEIKKWRILSRAAQLEREMIVERVKNKIATSKEQGLWMGGTLPLGYDVKDKELIINEKEAKIVGHIFERYLELKSMAELARELNSQGYRTKSDIFKKATVRRIITNPIYMGKIRHYEKEYEGKHEAIIKEEKWQKAQELIKNQPYRKAKYEEALLKGIIKCKSCGVNMTLTYAKKENKRYRYYVCNNHLRGKGCESINRTIVAGEVEKEVMRKTEQLYEKRGEKTEEKWKNLSFGKQKEVVKKLIKGVMVKEDGIEVSSESEEKFIPIKKKGNKCTVVEPEGKTNNALLKAVVRAHSWKRQLEEGKYGSVKELSAKINIGTRRIQQILRLNYLAPKIKEDIVNGRQPRDLKLVDLREIPMLWSEQLEKFYGLDL